MVGIRAACKPSLQNLHLAPIEVLDAGGLRQPPENLDRIDNRRLFLCRAKFAQVDGHDASPRNVRFWAECAETIILVPRAAPAIAMTGTRAHCASAACCHREILAAYADAVEKSVKPENLGGCPGQLR